MRERLSADQVRESFRTLALAAREVAIAAAAIARLHRGMQVRELRAVSLALLVYTRESRIGRARGCRTVLAELALTHIPSQPE